MEFINPRHFDCQDCGATVHIPFNAKVGEIVSCSGCGKEYEIVKLSKFGFAVKELELEEGLDYGE
jgi:lysine biosynthesis protein LysW